MHARRVCACVHAWMHVLNCCFHFHVLQLILTMHVLQKLQMQKMDSKFEGSCEYIDYTFVKGCRVVELSVGLTIPYPKD